MGAPRTNPLASVCHRTRGLGGLAKEGVGWSRAGRGRHSILQRAGDSGSNCNACAVVAEPWSPRLRKERWRGPSARPKKS
eukprot:7781345-Alexandrium_andersonii.AAC.1